MQSDVATPDEYLAALDADWRRDTLIELRDLVFELAPDSVRLAPTSTAELTPRHKNSVMPLTGSNS